MYYTTKELKAMRKKGFLVWDLRKQPHVFFSEPCHCGKDHRTRKGIVTTNEKAN